MNRATIQGLALAIISLQATQALVAQEVAPLPTSEAASIAAPGSVTRVTSSAVAPQPQQRQRKRRTSRGRRTQPMRVAPVYPYKSPTSLPALSSDISGMLHGRIRSGQWGVVIVSLSRGDTLYSHNPDLSLAPASTMKLFTTALALERLGADHHFSTDVLRDGPLDSAGTVNGNLIMRGDGDPSLSNRFIGGDVNAPMQLLARFVAGQGVRRVTGDLIADATAFDNRLIPEGWLSRYITAAYAARVSALSLNENLVWIAVHPGVDGGSPTVTLEPATTTIPIVNAVRSVNGSRTGNIAVRKLANGVLEVRGHIGTKAPPRRVSLIVDNPPLFTAGALRAALMSQGIIIDGGVRVGATPAGAVKVTSIVSPPLERLLSVMNRESINIYAELIYRSAARGRNREGVGSAERAFVQLREVLDSAKISGSIVTATDGSGLSSLNRITPRALVHLLAYSNQAPWASTFHGTLPVAGESELLRNRMRLTPAQGNLHAKTGTTNSVASLGGYVTARDGEVLAFAFVYNGADRWNAKMTMDQMGATLAAFVRE